MKGIIKIKLFGLFFMLSFTQLGFCQNVAEICTKDFYNRGNGLNALIMKIKRIVSTLK